MDPEEQLERLRAIRCRTRAARRGAWLPLCLLGLLTLAVSPLYVSAGQSVLGPPGRRPGSGLAPSAGLIASPAAPFLPGGSFLGDPRLVSIVWLVGLAACYAATVAYYRWRARRRGVDCRALPAVAAGATVLGVLVLTSPAMGRLFHLSGAARLSSYAPGLFVRGLVPLLVIAVVVVILAWIERSPALGLFAAAYLGLALLVNLYDVENLFYRIPVELATPQLSLVLPGLMLVAGGVGFALARERA